MRNLILSALLLASAFQTALGEQDGDWTYFVENGGATITASTATGAVTIPSVLGGYDVKRVGNNWPPVFGYPNDSVTSITIPNSVTSIGNSAFYGCFSLTGTLTIPNGVTSIGDSAFNNCRGLTSITIPNGVTSIGNQAFVSCYSLTSITIPNSLTSISDHTFNGCSGLTSITIPNGVTSIGYSAFAFCDGLTSVVFLGNQPILGTSAFLNSSPTIYYTYGAIGWSSTFGGLPVKLAGFLSVTCDSAKGTYTQTPNSSYYDLGAQVTVSVTPQAGYLFKEWSGASTSSSSSITLTIDVANSVIASFDPDTRDNDSDGLTNFQESITYGTNPNQKDTNSDGVEDGQAVALGYSPTFNFGALITHLQSHPPTGLYTTSQYTDNYNAGQTAGRSEVTSFPSSYNLYTATQYGNNYNAGQQNVISNPNTHNLYTTSQIQNMAVGDLVLSRQSGGGFVLNYDIEQSTDLQNWTRYEALSLPLNGLPTDKAFVRIKVKQ